MRKMAGPSKKESQKQKGSIMTQKNQFPKLHNAAWPGVVGKGSAGASSGGGLVSTRTNSAVAMLGVADGNALGFCSAFSSASVFFLYSA